MIIASLLLLAMVGAALPEAWAGDREDCRDILKLIQTDPARAAGACRRLADQGVATAQHNLGTLYVRGEGVPHDYVEAATWFRKAANQGLLASQSALGVMYVYGLGVAKDDVQAYVWLTLAAAQGDANAAKARAKTAASMTPSQIEKAQALAAAWKPTTAGQ